jgi:hypothetical protein
VIVPSVNGSSSSLMVAVDLDGMHLMWRIHGFKLIIDQC